MHGVEIFFKYLLGPSVQGFVCVAQLSKTMDNWKETWFEWPNQIGELVDFTNNHALTHNLYVCPQLFSRRKRIKEYVKICTAVWADLDACPPENCLVTPTIAVRSSAGRYQAYWVLETPGAPEGAEELSKRIAYYHAFEGADKSGWDLTQMLRIPTSFNYKHNPHGDLVTVLEANRNKYRYEDFKVYPLVDTAAGEDVPLPKDLEGLSGREVLDRHVGNLPPQVDFLFENIPDGERGWSEPLWRLQRTCFEWGLSLEEVYIVARDSACNKYKRDNKSTELLWKEVCRSHVKHREVAQQTAPQVSGQDGLLYATEREHLKKIGGLGFVDDYIAWAKSLGDAAEQYHQAGAFVILSALLGGSVRLPTSFGTVKPNLWFMILADTTLTRKSTAMDIAMDLIEEVDSGAILATDGSIEGLMGSLATRPGQPSVFLRDEFSGLLESITKKDYYAGMAETLTKLYDGKLQKRVLKKEVIEVKDPVLILFAGGIKNKVCGLLTHEHVSSGFIPRFIFITAESDTSKVRPLGPPSVADTTGRINMLERMREMYMHYRLEPKIVQVDGRLTYDQPPYWEAQLTQETWQRYNALEAAMMEAGLATDQPDIMTPTYDRLCKSTLKAAVLLAASRQRPAMGSPIQVGLDDLLRAIQLCEGWREYGNGVIRDVGMSQNERELQRIVNAVMRLPGISRSKLMQNHHLTSRSAEQIFNTLEQRGMIVRMKSNGSRGERIFPAGHNSGTPVTVNISAQEASSNSG